MSDMHKFDQMAIATELGQKVSVSRETTQSEASKVAASLLLEAGALLNPEANVLEYVGAAAVHIYMAPNIGQVVFVNQFPLGKATEELAGKAVTDLRGTLMEAYGQKRQTKRSGL